MKVHSIVILVLFWLLVTYINYDIYRKTEQLKTLPTVNEPKKKVEPARQNEPLYISLLSKVNTEAEGCVKSTDPEGNVFFTCKDGTKISMIKWTRGTDRKGIVTREYNPQGELILIYGHPDDVY